MEPTVTRHHTGLESSGGATRVARLLVDGLAAAGHDAALSFELAESGGAPTAPAAFGPALPAGAIPHLHCSGDWPALLGSLPEARRTVVTLHDCELFTGGCPYPLDCRALQGGCETCPRRFPDAEARRKLKYRLLHRLEPALVSPSRWLARLAKSHLHLPVTVIPNAVPWPAQPPRRDEARQQLGINPAARVALFVAHGGEQAEYKAGSQWRALWQRIRQQVPGSLAFIVGGQTAAREDGLIVWPFVERERLALLMAAADLLLYPTRADNHSLTILEAMARGLAVAAFATGGVPEQIADEETGLLVEPGDLNAFVQRSARLLASPGRCRDLGRNGFSFGAKRFAVERMVADYVRLYATFK
ncbi:MAG: glycosyltransferase [Pseudodesulfovibrio sp.]